MPRMLLHTVHSPDQIDPFTALGKRNNDLCEVDHKLDDNGNVERPPLDSSIGTGNPDHKVAKGNAAGHG